MWKATWPVLTKKGSLEQREGREKRRWGKGKSLHLTKRLKDVRNKSMSATFKARAQVQTNGALEHE